MTDNQSEDAAKYLHELLEPGSTLMVGTGNAGSLEFRPLTVAGIWGNRIQILLDTNEEWVSALHDGGKAYVTMSDTKANTWVSLRGAASTTTEAQLIDDLWNPFAGAYFENGRDTPGIAVLQIDAEDGRYWSSPSGRLGSLISLVKAKLGNPEQSGEHGDIAL
ncbi:MAG: pyridoxamine 5'-phosphate oxidase family protein [Ilumatobacteraceae bacterium]